VNLRVNWDWGVAKKYIEWVGFGVRDGDGGEILMGWYIRDVGWEMWVYIFNIIFDERKTIGRPVEAGN
jgi:hypothetical protein